MRDPTSFLGYTSIPLLLTLLIAVPASRSGGAGGDAAGTSAAHRAPFRTDVAQQEPRPGFGIGEILLEQHLAGQSLNSIELDVLIATAPDPVESSLDWIFDTHVTAIRRALEETDYVIDRSWFPLSSDSVTIVRAGSAIRVPAGDEQPGVMLFRDVDANRDRHVLVYLVGELPTSGVHGGALRSALDERAVLLSRVNDSRTTGDPTDTVKVLGPTFSGSAESLRRVLDTWASEQPAAGPVHYRVATGSATSRSVEETLTGAGSRAAFQFTSAVHSDDAYMATLEESVFRPLDIDSADVAFLVEGNTAYGRSLMDGGYTIISCPSNIGAVREEYAGNPDIAAARAGLETVGAPEPRLPLSLSIQARPRETPTPRSTLTPAALDLLLDEIVNKLQTHRFRALGIMATDVRDKLFLARAVKERLRDIQLFTFESNVLFLRPDFAPWLRGMVVLSTYPLFAESQAWTGRGNSYHPFSHDGSQGAFNATLMLLGRTNALVDYRPPIARETEAVQPPVWITTVGRGVLLPIRAVQVEDDYIASVSPDPDRNPESHEAGLLVFMVFAVAVALIGILAIWFGEETMAEVSTVPWIAALVVMAPLGPLSLIHDLAARALGDVWRVTGSAVLLLALLGSLLVHSLRMRKQWAGGPGAWEVGRLGNFIVPFAALALGVIGAAYAFQVWHFLLVDPTGFALYRFRALRLDGGASPLVPLLLACVATAAGYGWHASRVRLLERDHSLEKISLANALKGESAATVRKAVSTAGAVRDAFTTIVPPGILGLGALVLVPGLIVFLPVAFEFRTVENLHFEGFGAFAPSNMILSWALLGGLLTVAGSTLHLFQSGKALCAHLEALADTPLLIAFERIPDRLRALGRLYLFDPPAPERGEAVFKGLLASVRAQLGRRWGDVEPGQPEVDRLYSSLVDQWEKRPHAIELGQAGAVKPSGDTNLLRAAETAAAVEVVRFIGWALGNLRRLTILLLGSILFTTATLVSFPMPVRGYVTVLFWLLMICSLGIVVMIAGNLSQDEVLSRINGTEPGRITWNRTSMLSVIVIVSLPILGLLAAEVPAVGRALFSWVDPLLRVLINV
jgi:hypothetical protein